MESGKKRGGYRANAKRPKKAENEKFVKRQIFFEPLILEKLTPQYFEQKGVKNLSEYVRFLVSNDVSFIS